MIGKYSVCKNCHLTLMLSEQETSALLQCFFQNFLRIFYMDIRMPVMKGDEATMKIRALDREDCKRVPIIAMTANALESDVENSYQCGMNGHISKPIEPDEVYRCLNKWLMGDSKIEQ